MLHEIGHDALHREEAVKAGGFKEFNIFDMRQSRMEYEANIFASQISLPDDEILEYIENGYDIQQIARAMHSDINLVALKTDTLTFGVMTFVVIFIIAALSFFPVHALSTIAEHLSL